MTNVDNIVNSEDDDKVVQLSEYPNHRLMTGGRDGNWLKNMPIGSIFLARPINFKSFQLNEFHVINITDRAALLEIHSDGGVTLFWADQVIFSAGYDLVEIIRIP